MSESNTKIDTAFRYLQAGRTDDAALASKEILSNEPDNPAAMYVLAICSHARGDSEKAIRYLRRALVINPEIFDVHCYLARVLCEQQDLNPATQHLQKAITLNPTSAEAYHNLGNVYSLQGNVDAAIEQYKSALLYKKNYLENHHALGNAYQMKELYSDALLQYKKVISINPSIFSGHQNLGLTYHHLQKYEKASSCFIRSLEIRPDCDQTHFLLGTEYLLLDQYPLAQKSFEHAIKLNPRSAPAYCNLGHAATQQLELDAAENAFSKAIALDSACAEAYYGLSKIFSRLGQSNKTIQLLRQALEARPDYLEASQSLLMHLHYSSDISSDLVLREHRSFSNRYENLLSQPSQSHQTKATNSRKFRIGYVSPDLRRHSVAYFIEPVLAHHDRDKFEIYLYHNNKKEDEVSERLKALVDHWKNISLMDDIGVVELIQKNKIDILVDLAGHSLGNRLPVFICKPAPVQVTWIGYPGTTGLSAIDFRITDSFADPQGVADNLHSETLLRLPTCFSTYQPDANTPPVNQKMPADVNGFITFGSFNSTSKVNQSVIKCWSEILAAVPSARLILKHEFLSADRIMKAIQKSFLDNGIDTSRIKLLGRTPTHTEHMNCYNTIDIALDTFPYNGTTTTCESLWMGVPVIALMGDTHVSRVGHSLLNNIGYPELIAPSYADYINKAISLARNKDKLRDYRRNLRTRFSSSPIMDARTLTNNLELNYLKMWAHWSNSH